MTAVLVNRTARGKGLRSKAAKKRKRDISTKQSKPPVHFSGVWTASASLRGQARGAGQTADPTPSAGWSQ